MRLSALTLALALSIAALASTPATFRGKVIEFPNSKNTEATILVMGRNGAVRKVQVGAARVSYAEAIPQKLRRTNPNQSLKHGAEVRVEAEENGHGLWRARTIEILAVPGMPQPEEHTRQKPKAPDEKPAAGPVLSKRG